MPTGGLQVVDIVVHIDLRLDPVGHLRGQALAADVALERRAHLDDVEVDGAGGDRLLQAGVVVGLREVDPVDLGAGIGLPRLQEAAEQEVVQVLVVEAHEGELDAGELAFLDVGLGRRRGRARRPSASRRRSASPCRRRDLQDLRNDAVVGKGRTCVSDNGRACGQRGRRAAAPFRTIAPASLHRHELFVHVHTHRVSSRF